MCSFSSSSREIALESSSSSSSWRLSVSWRVRSWNQGKSSTNDVNSFDGSPRNLKSDETKFLKLETPQGVTMSLSERWFQLNFFFACFGTDPCLYFHFNAFVFCFWSFPFASPSLDMSLFTRILSLSSSRIKSLNFSSQAGSESILRS